MQSPIGTRYIKNHLWGRNVVIVIAKLSTYIPRRVRYSLPPCRLRRLFRNLGSSTGASSLKKSFRERDVPWGRAESLLMNMGGGRNSFFEGYLVSTQPLSLCFPSSKLLSSALPFFISLLIAWMLRGRVSISHLSSTGNKFLVAKVYLVLFSSIKFFSLFLPTEVIPPSDFLISEA